MIRSLAAATRLVEAGEITVDTRIGEAATDVAVTNAFEGDAPVRVVHLMEHPADWDDIQMQEYRSFPDGATLSEGLAGDPRSHISRWAPGRYASYANSGPTALGLVIEHAPGPAFEDGVEALVFDPLGLESASFEQDTVQRVQRRIPSYASTGEAVAPQTVARMERAETSHAAETGLPPFGLGVYPVRDVHALLIRHAGAIDASRAEMLYDRQAGFAHALLVNTGGGAFPEMRDGLGAGAPDVHR